MSVLSIHADVLTDSLSLTGDRLIRLTLRSGLAHLPGHVLLGSHLRRTVRGTVERGDRFTMLFVSLSNFGTIGSACNRRANSRLLLRMTGQVGSTGHNRSAITHLKNSRFILLVSPNRPRSTTVLTRHLIRGVQLPCMLKQRAIRISTDVNVTVFPRGNLARRRLVIGTSTTVCRTGRRNHSNCYFFRGTVGIGTRLRLRVRRSLQYTLSQGRFVLRFRPGVLTPGNPVVNIRTLLH